MGNTNMKFKILGIGVKREINVLRNGGNIGYIMNTSDGVCFKPGTEVEFDFTIRELEEIVPKMKELDNYFENLPEED